MRLPTAAITLILSATCAAAEPLPTSVEVTIEPQKFGDTASILQVDSTVATFRFDRPVQHLALVLESRPKEPRTTRVARLSLQELKESLGIAGPYYDQFIAFKKEVLRPNLAAINQNTDCQVAYDTYREGRKVAGVVFTIDKRRAAELFGVAA